MANPTPHQVAALCAARSFGLRSFRKGYAPDRAGPFFAAATIRALERKGLIRITATGQRAVATEKGTALAALLDAAPLAAGLVSGDLRGMHGSSQAEASHATIRDGNVAEQGAGPDR